jgi:hypothetical protein
MIMRSRYVIYCVQQVCLVLMPLLRLKPAIIYDSIASVSSECVFPTASSEAPP